MPHTFAGVPCTAPNLEQQQHTRGGSQSTVFSSAKRDPVLALFQSRMSDSLCQRTEQDTVTRFCDYGMALIGLHVVVKVRRLARRPQTLPESPYHCDPLCCTCTVKGTSCTDIKSYEHVRAKQTMTQYETDHLTSRTTKMGKLNEWRVGGEQYEMQSLTRALHDPHMPLPIKEAPSVFNSCIICC